MSSPSPETSTPDLRFRKPAPGLRGRLGPQRHQHDGRDAADARACTCPQPEVQADDTNPKGFGEPRWVVDLHAELLKRSDVQVSDARPSAWFEAGKLATDEELRERLHGVAGGAVRASAATSSSSRTRGCRGSSGCGARPALRCDATPSYVTMLRPVTEVVGSKQKYYAGAARRGAPHRRLGQHDAAHRASHPGLAAGLRPLRRPARPTGRVPLFALGEPLRPAGRPGPRRPTTSARSTSSSTPRCAGCS